MRRRLRWPGIVVAALVGLFVGVPLVVAVLGVVIGLVAAAVGLAIAFLAVAWPFLLLAVVIRASMRGSTGARRRRVTWHTVPPARGPAQAPSPPAPPPPVAPGRDPADWLPEPQRTQVDRIRRKAAVLEQQPDRFPAGSRTLYTVRRMRSEYLPWTLDSYLALPPGGAERTVTPDGRTGLQVLQGQLDLLERGLDEAADELLQHKVGRLLANERFLEEHFGPREPPELTIPSPSPGDG